MRAIHIEFLQEGAIPVYDLGTETGTPFFTLNQRDYTQLNGPLFWDRRSVPLSHRTILNIDLELRVSEVSARLHEALQQLEEEIGDLDGSFLCPVRGTYTIEELGQLMCGGLAFLPDHTFGDDLDGGDPAMVIQQTLEADGVDFETLHPAAQRARQRIIEDRIAWEAGREQRELEAREREEKRRTIGRRARLLLRECLTKAQHESMVEHDHFYVRSGDGHTYLIRRAYGHNVFRVEDGMVTMAYCIIGKDRLPVYDLMLGQKLMLEHTPERFHETANYQKPKKPIPVDRLRKPSYFIADLIGDLGAMAEEAAE